MEPWPVLLPSDWLKVCLESDSYKGFYVLGGNTVENLTKVEEMFERFWTRHSYLDPKIAPQNPGRTIPLYVHGDEGRGQVKRPIMIVSVQPIISAKGEDCCNAQGYHAFSFTIFASVLLSPRGQNQKG